MLSELRECLSLLFMRCTLPFVSDGHLCDLVEEVGHASTRACIRGDMRALNFGTDMLAMIYVEMAKRGLIDMSEAP